MKGRTPETTALVNRLSTLKAGEIVSFEELETIAHEDPRAGKGYARVNSAKRIVQNELGIVLTSVPSVGYMRLTDAEIARTGRASIIKAGKQAKRSLETVLIADYAKLSPEDKLTFNTSATVLNAITEVTKPATIIMIELRVAQVQARLEVGDTLRLFHEFPAQAGGAKAAHGKASPDCA